VGDRICEDSKVSSSLDDSPNAVEIRRRFLGANQTICFQSDVFSLVRSRKHTAPKGSCYRFGAIRYVKLFHDVVDVVSNRMVTRACSHYAPDFLLICSYRWN